MSDWNGSETHRIKVSLRRNSQYCDDPSSNPSHILSISLLPCVFTCFIPGPRRATNLIPTVSPILTFVYVSPRTNGLEPSYFHTIVMSHSNKHMTVVPNHWPEFQDNNRPLEYITKSKPEPSSQSVQKHHDDHRQVILLFIYDHHHLIIIIKQTTRTQRDSGNKASLYKIPVLYYYKKG